jgi:cell fate regulator YaaT (PSP1 superfamily)
MANIMSPARTETVAVRFQKIGKLYYFDCSAFAEIQPSDYVIVETARGRQMGQVMGYVRNEEAVGDHKAILRIATPRELLMKQYWEAKQVEALINCREKAAQLGGYDMCKFIEAQYNYDGSYLTILFSAENAKDKVNVNRLRTTLGNLYPKTRVELRQIGARDVAKSLGGMGACGIPRCCSTFLTDFSPVSIKMAKAQGISLNPSEITGMCGRLRCCLIYEYEQYVQARKDLPKKNKMIGTPHGAGKVIDVHPLQDAVTVLIEEIRYIVQRADIEPLDELRALEEKAAAGCSKSESGGCDCGAKGAKAADGNAVADSDADENDDNLPGTKTGASAAFKLDSDDLEDEFDE